MKHASTQALRVLIVVLITALTAAAQAPPGWGWVNKLGTYVPNTTNANGVAGLGRDAAGNLYLLGTYVGAPLLGGTPTTSQGGADIFLAKYAPTGALLWLRTMQSTGDDKAQALVVEPSGRCTVAGYYGGPTGGNLAFGDFNSTTMLPGPAVLNLAATGGYYGALTFVATVDANGALLWADTPSPAYGGLNVQALHRDGNGNCYVSANTNPQGTLVVNGQNYPAIGTTDAVLLKYLPTGQIDWARRVGVPRGSGYSGEVYTDAANAVYWLVGHNGPITIDQTTVGVTSNTGNMSVLKLSANNRVRWFKNNLLSVGSQNVVSQLLGVDVSTNVLYLSCYSTGGSVAFAGGNPVAAEPNALTAFVARCDTAGNVQWVKPYMFSTNVPGGLPGPRGAGIRGFAVIGNGFTMTTSTVSYNQTTYYGGSKSYGLAEGGLPCVLHYNTITSQAEWIRIGGTPSLVGQTTIGSTVTNSVADNSGNVYVAGNFTGTAQFGTTTIQSTSTSQPEIFLAKLDQSIVTATAAGSPAQPWSIFPNPSTGVVQLRGLPASAHVQVRDAIGRIIQELPALGTTNAIPERVLGGLLPGLYLLQITNTRELYRTQKLLVQ
ncbi:T9SS type A sorting domain-containing protein [Hymenobacter sp. UYCo722]|uniref:T9SS type A sorting domain-containing protein n=1 Tax=Hymenobacter sp. UYCo722 TaxID=3156335 RepID=UPI0033991D5C